MHGHPMDPGLAKQHRLDLVEEPDPVQSCTHEPCVRARSFTDINFECESERTRILPESLKNGDVVLVHPQMLAPAGPFGIEEAGHKPPLVLKAIPRLKDLVEP